MRLRIFEIETETANDGKRWASYKQAAGSAEEALKIVRKREFSPRIQERVLEIKLFASED